MKLSFTIVLFMTLTVVDATLGGQVQVLENFLDLDECDTFLEQALASVDQPENYSGRHQGFADLLLAIAHRMYKVTAAVVLMTRS